MKEATGELNMTVITVIAIAAVAALFYTLVWPTIQRAIVNNTCSTLGDGWHAVKFDKSASDKVDVDNQPKYVCCPADLQQYDDVKCVNPN